jgi:hypothetical protein
MKMEFMKLGGKRFSRPGYGIEEKDEIIIHHGRRRRHGITRRGLLILSIVVNRSVCLKLLV